MREYELEVLERYDMEVKSTRRIRGAFFCDTNEGLMLLKETKISKKRAPLLYIMLNRLEMDYGFRVDTPVFTRDGELLAAARDGTVYMMKKWYPGHECDMKRESEIFEAARVLACLHEALSWKAVSRDVQDVRAAGLEECAPEPPVRRDPLEETERRNREMKKVRSFIRGRVTKNEFEYLYLDSFERMYSLAQKVTKRMEMSGCTALYNKSVKEKKMVHGDYNYHNLLMGAGETAVTNFEHVRMDIQMQDLYYFLRKAMEKHHWKRKLGLGILDAYQSVRSLESMEKEYVGLCLAYPEKFWKTASTYARSNKAWLPEKSVEKLKLAVRQTEEKADFLESVFSMGF